MERPRLLSSSKLLAFRFKGDIYLEHLSHYDNRFYLFNKKEKLIITPVCIEDIDDEVVFFNNFNIFRGKK